MPNLLARLAEIPDGGWVRFLYAYPNRVTQKLLDTIAEHQRICSYIDVPLQHASASVLKRMKRGGSGDIFLKMIEKARRTIPDVAVRTAFIVGFPGETEQDFDELCQFVEAAQFDRVGVFRYSDDETSGSFALDGKVDERTIYNRQRKLMAIQRKISRKRNRALVGRTFPILLSGPSTEHELLWEGRMQSQAEEIDGKTYILDFPEGQTPKPGDMGMVHITRASDYDVFGMLESIQPRTAAETGAPLTTGANALGQLPVLQ
ncbi:MAG: radical SAM protein [Bryobacterales bacterium]